MSNTLVFVGASQSNDVSKNTLTSVTGNLGPPFYTTTATGIRILTWDGFLTPDSWPKLATDPWADPTNAVDEANHAARQSADSLSSLGANSNMLPFCDYLRAGGNPANTYSLETRNIIVVPCALASTYIAANWKDSGGFATEPCGQTLLGTLKRRLDAAMIDAPNAKLGAIFFDSGESEAADMSNATSLTLATDLGNVMDQINTYVSFRGYSWDKNLHFIITRLSTGYAGAPLNWSWVGNVNTAFDSLVSGRTDTKQASDSFSGAYIHRDRNDQLTIAAAKANVWLSST